MKKHTIITFLLITQICAASTWFTSFEEAQKIALGTNKLMIVDFWASWCRPCKEMDKRSWNNEEVEMVLEDFVKVKINVDANRDLANKYGIRGIPNMIIMDGNGKVVHSFTGYLDPKPLRNELDRFALSTEFLSLELINFYKNKNFYPALKVSQKYYEYSLLVDKNIKGKILKTSIEYLEEAQNLLNKKDLNYERDKQRLELYKLYSLAYSFDFKKLKDKLSEIKPEQIDTTNEYPYWFLVYIAEKGLGKETKETEEIVLGKDLEEVIAKGNQLYSFHEKVANQ
ncbi:thioredoxin family protein [Flavobacterium phragmitis]|uniref:Thioredoxin n=1 Tax=Flavobacterium phragmitis TaxID=739143 RepID=A0A1I1UKR8_9FLAO|nr:thioredoxin family protein [Flavobacterium phragmitis]SFD71359.1 Thioredoxin [Flavobacterium phragmitis]